MTGPAPVLRWSAQRRPAIERFPYHAVVTAYQHHGKHFVPADWTQALAAARDQVTHLDGDTRHLEAFLAGALDKVDGRFDYRSYLGLALLPIPTVDHTPGAAARQLARRDRLYAQLLTDLIAFELRAATDDQTPLPRMRPTSAVAAKRLRHALRAVMPALRRLSYIDDPSALPEIDLLGRVIAAANLDRNVDERRALQVSMLPVHTIHDEWMFIRVLQAFETTFALLASDLTEIIGAVRAGLTSRAAAKLSAAASLLRESATLWPLLATIQPAAFHAFRPYTDRASAIQSRHYKLLESLCRRPDGRRLNSPAYLSVPEVRTAIIQGQVSLDDALDSAQQSAAGDAFLASAMREFTAAITQWRQTHYRLAVRILGADRTGTGYTQGTPYLNDARTEPVFRHCPWTDPDAGGRR